MFISCAHFPIYLLFKHRVPTHHSIAESVRIEHLWSMMIVLAFVLLLYPVSVCIESAVYIVDDPNILNRFDRLVVARED